MSSVGLTSALGSLSNATSAASPVKAASTASTGTATQASTTLKDDTVKLSIAAQVKLMHRQGESPALIASTLGTNVASVDGYLGIKVATPTTTTSAVPEPSTSSTAQPQEASPQASSSSSTSAVESDKA